MYSIGTTVEITRDQPYSNLKVGDIGVVTDIFGNYYYVQFYGKRYTIRKNELKKYIFKNGDRIKVTTDKSKYKGYFGTIYGYDGWNDRVHLFVDGTKYQPCEYEKYKNRYLTLKETSVQLIKKQNEREEKVMSKLTGYKKVAGIKLGGGTYYYALYDEDVVVGDSVLVSGTFKEVGVVDEILTVDAANAKLSLSKPISSEVKCKVDLSAYETRVQNRAKAEELRKKMDEKIAEMDELNKYVLYAERNPELANMLAEFRELVL